MIEEKEQEIIDLYSMIPPQKKEKRLFAPAHPILRDEKGNFVWFLDFN